METNREANKQREEDRLKEKTAGRVNHLVNDVENYTRTERHLEQHSDISDRDRLKNAIGIQREKKEQIKHLKNIIIHSDCNTCDGNVDNLQKDLKENQKNKLVSMDQMDIK